MSKTMEELTLQPKQIAKTIRKNLLNQKKKLEDYLVILDKESSENHMTYNDADKLISHIELENNIIKDLENFKKIITPVEAIYLNVYKDADNNIVKLKSSIDLLTKKVITKSTENRNKLETILVSIDTDVSGIVKKKLSKAIYNSAVSKVLDVTG
jgi:hypothetical protein